MILGADLFCDGIGYGIDDLKIYLRIFVISEYLNSPPQLFQYERKTIRTLVAEEMYYGLIISHAKQCKLIHDELTTNFIA